MGPEKDKMDASLTDSAMMEIKKEPLDDDEKIRRTTGIIMREFAREIGEREEEVVRIQEKINLTQRYIKILKYVATYSYFQGNDANSNTETAIHPCVQRLLPSKENIKVEPSSSTCDFNVKVEIDASEDTQEAKPEPVTDVTIVRGSYKVRHSLVAGNVSKWIPPDYREDESTHKWMLYIRDMKRDEDLIRLIKKVRYFLHESYKPHDIIDVTSYPFHLTRRGWGEFPVRVIIFFKHPDNKPIDFIHQLRLDDMFSGRQTLGGETMVEVDLFDDNIDESVAKEIEDNMDESLAKETEEPPPKRKRNRLEELIALEHDYCLSSESVAANLDSRPLFQPQQISSACDFSHCSEMAVIQSWCPKENMDGREWYKKSILKRAESIYFLSSEACVKWFLQRWPMITNFASNPLYKMFHPYTFPSVSSFALANVGRQRAAEWFRAFKIKQMMKDLGVNAWTTKQVMMYSRMHGYVLVFGKQYNCSPSKQFKNISTYTSEVDSFRDLRLLESGHDYENVDVVGLSSSQGNPSSPVKPSRLRICAVSNSVTFVEEISRQIGIKFKDEEVLPDKFTNASVQILGRTLKLFLNGLLRKSLANAWCRNSRKSPASVEVEDIVKTIVENPEFDVFTNAGLGAKNTFS